MSLITIQNTIVSFFLIISISVTNLAQAQENNPTQLKIAVLQSSSDPSYLKPVQQWFVKIYTQAFSRMGIQLSYRILPPKRASLYTDEGLLDGELSRVYDYGSQHPNLVRVEEHHIISVFSAFSSNSTISLNGWGSLKNTNYHIEYRRGIKKSSENISAVVPPKRRAIVNSIQGGIKKLVMNRSDIFIDSEDGVFDYLNSDEYKAMSQGRLIYKVGVMEAVTSHFWLHHKHQELAPLLSTTLKEMKKEGLFALYLKEVGMNPALVKW